MTSQAYKVEWTPPARRDMARLPAKVAVAVLTYVDHRLAVAPRRRSKPLVGDLAHLRSARNGAYRVLFRIEKAGVAEDAAELESGVHQAGVLWIVRVDHRAHAYRPR